MQKYKHMEMYADVVSGQEQEEDESKKKQKESVDELRMIKVGCWAVIEERDERKEKCRTKKNMLVKLD